MIPNEIGNFNRLLVSVGLFLSVASVAVPWLVLRENSSLLVSRERLDGLTPQAREAIEHRQQLAADVAKWIPLVSGVMAVVGLGLLIWGAYRLRKVQEYEDTKAEAEATKATADAAATVVAQTPEDTEERLDEEAAVAIAGDLETELAANAPGPTEPTSPAEASFSITRGDLAVRRQTLHGVEQVVVDRLTTTLSDRYIVRPAVKVEAAHGRGRLLLDALLQPHEESAGDDLVVDVRLSSLSSSRNAMLVDRVVANALRYQHLTARPARAWLIVVLDPDKPAGPYGPSSVEQIQRNLGWRMAGGRLDVIWMADLQGWTPSP